VSALRRIDKVLASGCWATAAVLVVMLLAGPAVIANDSKTKSGASAGYGANAAADGARLFKDNCGSCHTLTAAGTRGTAGPNLDNTSLSQADIESKIGSGGGGMPSFGGKLSEKEIKAVAAYVSASH
jgi:mono/diheme cytochrome c family protein